MEGQEGLVMSGLWDSKNEGQHHGKYCDLRECLRGKKVIFFQSNVDEMLLRKVLN